MIAFVVGTGRVFRYHPGVHDGDHRGPATAPRSDEAGPGMARTWEGPVPVRDAARPVAAPLPGAQRYWPRVHHGPRVVMIDNYDSFTFNLVQYLMSLGALVDVVRNDAVTADAVIEWGPTHLVLSPGPGRPSDSGVCRALCRRVCADAIVPTLGVCLGHQTLCEVHGASVVRGRTIMHGKVSAVRHEGAAVFDGLPSPMTVTRYHSLVVDEATLPSELVAIAHTLDGELMAVRHRERPVVGVQFHPESILSQHGHALLANFVGSDAAQAQRLDQALATDGTR